jgi:hypothetical protein
MKVKKQLEKMINDKIVDSLFFAPRTIDERQAERITFVIKNNTIYFLSHGELNKIKLNNSDLFCLGYGIEDFKKWYWQIDSNRHNYFVIKLAEHLNFDLAKNSYVNIPYLKEIKDAANKMDGGHKELYFANCIDIHFANSNGYFSKFFNEMKEYNKQLTKHYGLF